MLFFILPASLFANLQAPEAGKITISPYVDERERFERRINPTFSAPALANRSDLFSRFRVGFSLDVGSLYSGKIEYQNASDVFWTQKRNASTDSSDLSLAYAKYASQGLTLIGGRQKIDLGQQRLIGSAEWLNLARSFDAGRIRSGQWDAWYGKVGVANTKPESARVGAITHTDNTWGTTSIISKHDLGTVSGIDIQTLDHFFARNIGSVAVNGEGALQFGSNNGRDQRAWAFHLGAAQRICPNTTLSIEGDSASGGGNATTSRTFDNLYPSNHNMYGLADMIGWKNMNHLGARLENRFSDRLTLRAGVHAYSLRDTSDAWYAATGAANPRPGGTFVNPAGLDGRDLGKELDLEAIYSLRKTQTVSAGIAFFEPGTYVQNVSGHSSQFTYGYLQLQVRF